jgi:hypothetical protein
MKLVTLFDLVSLICLYTTESHCTEKYFYLLDPANCHITLQSVWRGTREYRNTGTENYSQEIPHRKWHEMYVNVSPISRPGCLNFGTKGKHSKYSDGRSLCTRIVELTGTSVLRFHNFKLQLRWISGYRERPAYSTWTRRLAWESS